MKKSDHELVLDYMGGDTHAFEGLLARYLKPIYNFVFQLCGDIDESHDITAEVFLKLWRSLKKYDESKNFKAWLYTIARNTTYDWLRKRKHFVFSDFENEDKKISFEENLEDTAPLPNEVFEQKELGKLLKEALSHIPLDYRSVILLRHNENLTFEEIAEVTAKPMNTVKSQYRRGLHLLQEYLLSAPK
jgi:RNA polymerase sigma-70 factor (ECF subfamily)